MGRIYKQTKYCDDCKAWFSFETDDNPNENQPCPVEEQHSTRDHTILGECEYCEREFLPNHDSTFGYYATRSVEANSEERFTFVVPADFSGLRSLELIGMAVDSVSEVDIDLASHYGKVGEAKDVHTESKNDGVYSFTASEKTAIDISPIFSALEPGDSCGLYVKHNAIGTTIHYLYVKMKYEKKYCSI